MSMFPRAGLLALATLGVSQAFALEAPSTENAKAAVALVSDGVAPRDEADPACPKIVMAPDGETFARKPDDYLATVEAFARDCANLGAETILKVAVVGEGTRDRTNGLSRFDAPLRVAVKDGEGHEVETRKIRVKVELPEGVQKVSFNHLEENVSLPPAPEGGYRNWTVTVGFERSAQTAAAPVPTPAPKMVKTTTTAKTAKAVRVAAVRRATRTAREPVAVAPVPVPAPDPAANEAEMRSQFQKLAAANVARSIEAREASAVEQRQLQLLEQAKAQAEARAAAEQRGQQANAARVEAKRARREAARGAPAPQPPVRQSAEAAPAAAQPQVRTAYNIR